MYRSQEADLNIYKEFGHQITVIAANRLESLLLGKIIKKITSVITKLHKNVIKKFEIL